MSRFSHKIRAATWTDLKMGRWVKRQIAVRASGCARTCDLELIAAARARMLDHDDFIVELARVCPIYANVIGNGLNPGDERMVEGHQDVGHARLVHECMQYLVVHA